MATLAAQPVLMVGSVLWHRGSALPQKQKKVSELQNICNIIARISRCSKTLGHHRKYAVIVQIVSCVLYWFYYSQIIFHWHSQLRLFSCRFLITIWHFFILPCDVSSLIAKLKCSCLIPSLLCVFSYCFTYLYFTLFIQLLLFSFNIIMCFRSVSALLFCPIAHFGFIFAQLVVCVCFFLIYVLARLLNFFPSVLESNFFTILLWLLHTYL